MTLPVDGFVWLVDVDVDVLLLPVLVLVDVPVDVPLPVLGATPDWLAEHRYAPTLTASEACDAVSPDDDALKLAPEVDVKTEPSGCVAPVSAKAWQKTPGVSTDAATALVL